ncbi:MAG: 3-dehydroquinate synthase, partial [Candidatus Margulisbacteria bacterium]|nr:3-dehydroquinate synthase [Candidatus Margulisiibacteriota bacterium]
SFIAYQKKMIDKAVFLRIKNLIKTFGLPVKVKYDANRVAKLLKYDKKVKAGKLRFVLPIKIGTVVVRDDIDVTLLKKALKEIKA